MRRALVWVFPLKRLVIVSEDLSPYTEGHGIGVFDVPQTFGWGEAGEVAKAKAKELGFRVDYHSLNYE